MSDTGGQESPSILSPVGSPRPYTPPVNSETYTPPLNEDSSDAVPQGGTNVVVLDENSRNSHGENSRNSHEEEEEPPAKIRKVEEDTDGESCPICLDSWNNSGEHRLVALKCGHLFGASCVKRWLRAQAAGVRCCPTCKTKAQTRDLRYIYARKLVAADTSQITTLQEQIEKIQSEKNRAELELEKSKIAHRACSLQLEVLRSLMKSQVQKDQPQRKAWRFALEKNLEVSKDGGCRVLTYNCRTYELYVSQKSGNNLFPGYGIRKVNCLDYSLGQFVHLHPKPIRDITYSQPRDLLLSVGLDGTAKIVERGIPNISINVGFPLWSCSWDYLRSNELYVGGIGGIIHQYDFRNTNDYVARLQSPSDMSPIVSLCSTEFGLLACQLNSSWLWLSAARPWEPREPRSLPVDEGPLTSLCYDCVTHRAVISCRPSASGLDRSKLVLCKLKACNGEVNFDVEETFTGSSKASVLSRSAWVKVPDASWIASHSESESCLYLHGTDGSRTMSLPAHSPALDITSADVNGNTIVAALSDSRLKIYRAVSMNS